MTWLVVILGSLGCFALKLIGYVLPERMLTDPRVRRVTTLIPIALLSALVVMQTLGVRGGITIDARFAGVLAAVVALFLRAPFLVVVIVAAVVAAGVRHLGLLA
jgi:branched-subunit amino acid transport protein